jgi:NADH:ubiquinone oxidoreductase subunit 5 (subunit L)/multisubunit Na+/H+ antiporter MnhA subunit
VARVAFIILLPWLGAVALPCLRPILGRHIGRWALLPPAASFLLTLTFVSSVARHQSLLYALPWFPDLGVNLTFWIDGLSVFFALLIAGIGLLITWYSQYYLDPSERLGQYFAYLMLFMGAMLGVVLSANLITLLVFWELTSVCSFLLIGFWHTRPESLYGARQALLVTVLGGLALLGGIVLIFQLTGTLELPELAKSSAVLHASPLYPVILGLILVGAGAKSAQFPLHFWLPNAMAAPTPVSAYLHSATMVKAGLFLVCRMLPVLGGTTAWMYTVAGIGLATFLVGGILALRQSDLKTLLAYSTVSQLGAIMALYGPATPESVRAATFHLFNHATFKGALFLLVGIIEHQTGSRDRRELTGLLPRLPVTGTLMAIAALSLAGVPPLNGFLSKELTFEALLTFPTPRGWGWLLPSIAVAGSLLTVTYSLALSVGIFWGRPAKTLTDSLHEPTMGMILAPAVLAALCVLHGAIPRVLDSAVLTPAVVSVMGPQHLPPVMLWHGLNLPVMMSLGALVGGATLYAVGSFVVLQAPDLALTQLLIETASLILILLVLRYLPLFRREMLSWWVRCRDVGVSIMVGGLVVLLLLIANSDTLYPSIASYFLEQSLRLGGGRNVVNVIVVDFRGYDTMGEITVLALAAIGVYGLIKLKRERGHR